MSNPNTAKLVAERDQLREKVAEIEAEVDRLREEKALRMLADSEAVDDCFVKVGKKLWEHTKTESKRLRNVIIESAKLLRSIEIHVCMDTWPDELRDRFYKALEILCDVQEEDDRG